jgi:hypothetical protein
MDKKNTGFTRSDLTAEQQAALLKTREKPLGKVGEPIEGGEMVPIAWETASALSRFLLRTLNRMWRVSRLMPMPTSIRPPMRPPDPSGHFILTTCLRHNVSLESPLSY